MKRYKKCSICDGLAYSKGFCKYHYYKDLDRRKKHKKVDKKLIKEARIRNHNRSRYKKAREAFFSKDENQFCKVRVEGVCGVYATDIHHMAGRIGELLVDKDYFLPVCRQCHRYIHDHSKWAEDNGFIVHL